MSRTPRPDADIPSVAAFLKTVARSGLVTMAELQHLMKALPPADLRDARHLADRLVRGGRLTRFQARKLLRGMYRGLVLGPYQVLSPIGKGGSSTVYLARDSRDTRLVAVKVLSTSRTEPRMLARFRREMDLSRLVLHPNLCRTFDSGESSGVLFIAMEYIPGRTLSRLVLSEGCPPWARAARLLAEVASGLAEAHSQGLIHRDLKPGNVMVTPHDQAKLLDLGLALVEGETVEDPSVLGGRGYVVGTVDYMAPEQTIDATDVDARSDLYALGCTAYFALSGKVPFPGGTRQEKIVRHRTAQPAPLTELVPGLPPGLVMVVQALMAKEPDHRPASAREVAQRLQAWAMDAPLAQVAPEEEQADFLEAVEALTEADSSTDFNWEQLPSSGARTPVSMVSISQPKALVSAPSQPEAKPAARRRRHGLGIAILVVTVIGAIILAVVAGYLRGLW